MLPQNSVERFRSDVNATLGHTLTGTVALAVSGGPDSMAMLVLAANAFPGAVIAATVDHGLRSDGATEAAMVDEHCGKLGVAHTTLRPERGWRAKSVQADARHLRYALLGAWAIDGRAAALLTAHHADDQAETFLMRAARGSGVAGLGGIRARWTWERHRWHRGYPQGGVVAVADAVPIIRPLLGWRRSELAQAIAETATPYVTDPSNADDRFDRARMRKLLVQHPEIDAVQLARAAAACAEADIAISGTMELLRRERLREDDVYARRYDVTALPRELRRRLARDAIGYVRDVNGITEGRFSDATNVETLLDALDAGGKATLAGVVGRAHGTLWSFAEAPPRRAT